MFTFPMLRRLQRTWRNAWGKRSLAPAPVDDTVDDEWRSPGEDTMIFRNVSLPMMMALPLVFGACSPDEGAAHDTLDPEDVTTETALMRAASLGVDPIDSTHALGNSGATALEKAFAALGGQVALTNLKGVKYTNEGERFAAGGSFIPDDSVVNTNHFAESVQYDFDKDRVRQDVVRRQATFGTPGQTLTFSITLNGARGEATGSESIFGIPGGPLSPDGAGAARRELDLLHPEGILRRVALNPALATELHPVFLGDRKYGRILVRDPVKPIRLYVDSETGGIVAASVRENDPLLRDTTATFIYQWAHSGGALVRTPKAVAIRANEAWVRAEVRDNIVVNPAFADAPFVLTQNPPVDAALSRRGAIEREYHQGFASVGILRIDGDKSVVTASDVASGVVLVGGDGYNSMLVEQSNGIVLVEAPLTEERSLALQKTAADRFPGKRITDVVVTHHHEDHMGGIRFFVSAGARVVIASAAKDYLERVVNAKSTILPDALANSRRSLRAVFVGQDPLTLADRVRPIVVHQVGNGHSMGMLVAVVPGEQLAFESDLWDPPFPPVSIESPAFERSLSRFLEAHAPFVTRIVPGHGIVSPVTQLGNAIRP